MSQQRYSKKEMMDAAKECRGVVAVMARRLGCSRKTVYNYRDRYPELDQKIIDEQHYNSGRAELGLVKAVEADKPWAIRFELLNGPNEKYQESKDVNVSDKRKSEYQKMDDSELSAHIGEMLSILNDQAADNESDAQTDE